VALLVASPASAYELDGSAGTSGSGTGAPAAAACGTQRTLTAFQSAEVLGNRYRVQANEWGSSAPFSIANDGCASFRIATSEINAPANGAPGAYPSLYRGCHWGTCTTNSGLPLQVGDIGIGAVMTSIDGSLITTGAWSYAYDIWFNRASQTTNNSGNGLEMMVWLAKNGPVQPAGAVVAGNAMIGGRSYTVWKGGPKPGGIVSYVLTAPATTLTNLDIGALAADSVARGYLTDAWWLIDVEAGFEPWQGGAGLAVTAFSVCTPAGC
jgi:cellulose 1,4-beta-cellobiosidase